MRLLIVTQVVDTRDPILGFFCHWILALSAHFERVEVICLQEGVHSFPPNVRVHSLGKERGARNRISYAFRFKRLIWRLRSDYDTVLVHMNPEYVILGGISWKLLGKRVSLWYNHPHGGLRVRVAAYLTHIIFYTSPYAATAHYVHAKRMPAGIDTELFAPRDVVRNRHALYMQGRIMPSKHVDIALAAFRLVQKKIPEASLTLVGPEDAGYGKKLRDEFADIIKSGAVIFAGPKPNTDTPALYSSHGISINLASDGHYDKSVLESIACGTPVVLCSHAFSEEGVVIAPNMFLIKKRTPEALSEMILFILREYARWQELAGRGRDVVIARESLEALVDKLALDLSGTKD